LGTFTLLSINQFLCELEQEIRAAARKPRVAEAILFGLVFANQANLTKQNRLCLIADL